MSIILDMWKTLMQELDKQVMESMLILRANFPDQPFELVEYMDPRFIKFMAIRWQGEDACRVMVSMPDAKQGFVLHTQFHSSLMPDGHQAKPSVFSCWRCGSTVETKVDRVVDEDRHEYICVERDTCTERVKRHADAQLKWKLSERRKNG